MRWVAVALTCAASAISPLSASKAEAPALLRWSPPALSAPITIVLPDTSVHLELPTDRDYILKLPARGLTGHLWIEGGHNIVLIGGRITVPASANQTDNGADDTDTGIYVKNAAGTVHIEGVAITAARNTMFDGIDVNAPKATVEIENVRITNLYGSDSLMHADAVQTWGGVHALLIDGLTVIGDYQGLTIDPDLGPVGNVVIQNADLTIEPVPAQLSAASSGGGHMIWLTRGASTCDGPSAVTFRNVYVNATTSLGLSPADVVWPQPSHTSLACPAAERAGRITWPRLPVRGFVTLGRPPDGPFVPSGLAGPGYRSPGYLQNALDY